MHVLPPLHCKFFGNTTLGRAQHVPTNFRRTHERHRTPAVPGFNAGTLHVQARRCGGYGGGAGEIIIRITILKWQFHSHRRKLIPWDSTAHYVRHLLTCHGALSLLLNHSSMMITMGAFGKLLSAADVAIFQSGEMRK